MGKKCILVVDDEENIRFLYNEELHDMGFSVELAKNAAEAEEKLRDKKPDLIILDIKMPDVDGIELLNRIRSNDTTTPIIISSAYNDYKQDFNVWGAEAYVVKSSDLTELKGEIKRILWGDNP
ncbi:MAG: response regulator [Nitrospinota bacterium]|nr:response regulator [Nitrospinota bacterium]